MEERTDPWARETSEERHELEICNNENNANNENNERMEVGDGMENVESFAFACTLVQPRSRVA